ncbi:MAG: hypothetical protein C4558_03465 [Dehalococcoidia bacterium]|nr:MAG: hypothetical protein C4558_03465 [Dehalococcoidia bacterium]
MPKTQKEIDREIQRGRDDDALRTPVETHRVTAVLALNNTEFAQWCADHGKSARDRNILMITPATTRNLKDAHLEITPRGMWRADIHILMQGLVPALDAPSQRRLGGMGWGQPVP